MLEQATNLSFSRINVLSSCRQKYDYKYISHKERLEPIGDYLRIGKVVDMALLYAVGAEGMTIDNMIMANDQDFFLARDQQPKDIYLDEKNYHFCNGIWDARERLYNEMFGEYDDVELQSFLTITLIDKDSGECIADDDGREIPWVQYLDAYSAAKNTIFEVKTYSGNIDQTFLEHQFGGQTQIYSFSKKMQVGSIPLVKYIYIKKPTIRQKSKETIEEFYERMYEAGLNATIEIREVQYTEEEIDETMKYYFDFASAHLHAGPVRDRNSCYKWGSPCEYYGHCWKNQVKKQSSEDEEAA